jgi:hypothetical protein
MALDLGRTAGECLFLVPFRSPNLGPDSSWLIEIAASGQADVFAAGEQKRPGSQTR